MGVTVVDGAHGMRTRRNDKGSAMALLVSLMALAGLGAVTLPRAANLADAIVARVDLEAAGSVVRMGKLPGTTAQLAALLRRDDPSLRLSGSAMAGRPSHWLPGTVGIAATRQSVVMVMQTTDRCFRATITPTAGKIASTKTTTCRA